MTRRGPGFGLVALLAAAACLRQPPRPDAVVRIDGQDLDWAAFEVHLNEVAGSPASELPQEALSELLDRWVEDRLLEHLAARTDGGTSVDTLLAAATRPVTEADVVAYYRAREGEYRRADRVDLEQVLLADRAAAQEAAARLAAGVDLERVLAMFAAPPADAQGWRQRSVEAGDLPPDLARVVFALGEGETSDVIQADFGFLVFRVRGRLPAGAVPLASVADEIRRELEASALQAARSRLVEEGRRRYDVAVFERNLPFTYRGRYASSTS